MQQNQFKILLETFLTKSLTLFKKISALSFIGAVLLANYWFASSIYNNNYQGIESTYMFLLAGFTLFVGVLTLLARVLLWKLQHSA